MKNLILLGAGLITFTMIGCVNLAHYKAPVFKVKPLQTKVSRIILHEDSIRVEDDSLNMRTFFVSALADRLSGMKNFEVIIVPSGKPLPQFGDNKGSIWIVGKIWSQRSEQSGHNVQLKTLYKKTKTSSSSWDVLETLNWNHESIMSFTNLYFIELSEDLKLLKSYITASNLATIHVSGNKGTENNVIKTHVEFEDPDKEATSLWSGTKSLFGGEGTTKRLATGYKVVSITLDNQDWKASLKKLAETSVDLHFPSKHQPNQKDQEKS